MTISNCETTSSNHAVKLQMKNKDDIYYSYATARTLFLHPVVCYPQGVLTTLDDTSAATRIKYCIINKCHEAKNRRKIIGLQSVFATILHPEAIGFVAIVSKPRLRAYCNSKLLT